MKLQKDHYKTAIYPSPFFSRTDALNQTREWTRWQDYMSAARYECETLEYFACRNATAVFDLTAMCKHRITGPDALAYLNRLVPRDVSKIKPGRVGYTVWCNDDGQVIDDGTIFHLSEGNYRLCSQERQLDWLLTSAIGFDVTITEETDDVAALAVQGPTSCAVLKAMGIPDIANLKPFGILHVPFEGAELMISRTGFTGDLGYELWIDPSHALNLWDQLFEAGRLHGIRPMGEIALQMARVEAGFIQARRDFVPADHAVRTTHTRSPYELDLGWLVDLKKPNFTGRAALEREKERGSRYRLVRLDIDGNKPAHASYVFTRNKKFAGTITSAMWSPTAKANIAIATLEMPHGEVGEELLADIYYQRELKWSRVMAPCRPIKGVFFDPPRRRATPAGEF